MRALSSSLLLFSTRIGSASQSLGALTVDVAGLAEDMRMDLATLGEMLEAIRALAAYLERDPGAPAQQRTGAPARCVEASITLRYRRPMPTPTPGSDAFSTCACRPA